MLTSIPHIASTRFTVVGAARSGIAAARLLQRHGAQVFVTEAARKEVLRHAAQAFDAAGVEAEFGGHTERAFDANVFVLSPGVPTESAIVQTALDRGIEVVSEIEVASWFCPAPIVAITGTNGKTTTTALAGAIFMQAGWNTVVAGNIGTAFSDSVPFDAAEGVVVLEVSSFQLDHVHLFHPRVAVITTITPDHLDRYHGSMNEYVASKQRVFARMTAEDTLIYNADYETIRSAVASATQTRSLPFSVDRSIGRGGWIEDGELHLDIGHGDESLLTVGDSVMRGAHNDANILAAALAARVMGVSTENIRQTCRSFPGVEHRLEFVRELGGVRYINDSKATNVDSLLVALQSMTEPVVLIAGGRDKGTPYEPLHELIRTRVTRIILIGEAAQRMEQSFAPLVPVMRADTMESAVALARSTARTGDVVLLSPACASFDMFDNFEHRGVVFKECVARLNGEEKR